MTMLTGPHAYAASTTAEFLEWEREAQVALLQISISMAGYIAAQIRPDIGECLGEWYYKTEALREQRQSEILEAMPEYTEFPPVAVVLGYIEGACGRFDQ